MCGTEAETGQQPGGLAQRQPHDAGVAALEPAHEHLGATLDRVAPGLAERLAGGDIGRDGASSSVSKLTCDTDTACSSRSADTSDTAEITSWLRPDRRRSIAAAASASAGLPNTSSSSTTSVSDPSTSADGVPGSCRRPATAFSRATRHT